jgi:hypothetical protein
LTAGEQLRLGAFVETFHSEETEHSFLSTTTTRRSWQEALVFDARCSTRLSLKSKRNRVTGEGANLFTPWMQIHGEAGIALNELRLIKTEEIETKGMCIKILGIDITDPFGNGIPIPKPSIEGGHKYKTNRTTLYYGQHGNINASRLEVSTGDHAEASFQGSALIAGHFVSNTPVVRFGGSTYNQIQSTHRHEATAGVAYVGAFVPTASMSASTTEHRTHGYHAGVVQVGRYENLRAGTQIHASQGIIGEIKEFNGTPATLSVTHNQTIT